MKQRIKTVALGLLVVGLVVANYDMAFGHKWWKYHWHKSTLGVMRWNCVTEADAARVDWDSHTDLSLPVKGSHTDISVWCDNFGDTGWKGLASLEDVDWDTWHCFWWCKIKHGHARENTYYGQSGGASSESRRRGTLCQEIGHTFGLDHSNTGGCMAKSYYTPWSNVTNAHNWADVNAMY